MTDAKHLLNQAFSDKELIEWKNLNTKTWNKDIRAVADLMKEHFEDPEALLTHLVKHVQNARKEGYPKDNFH